MVLYIFGLRISLKTVSAPILWSIKITNYLYLSVFKFLDEKDAEAAQEKRIAREMKLLSNKLKAYKEKKANALKERNSLRDVLSKQQKILREEKKKYRTLQKEVDKMAKLMKDVDDEDEEAEDEDEEEEVIISFYNKDVFK